jgi:hypothetical protein
MYVLPVDKKLALQRGIPWFTKPAVVIVMFCRGEVKIALDPLPEDTACVEQNDDTAS